MGKEVAFRRFVGKLKRLMLANDISFLDLFAELLSCRKCGLVSEDNGEKVIQPECIEHLTTVIEVLLSDFMYRYSVPFTFNSFTLIQRVILLLKGT